MFLDSLNKLTRHHKKNCKLYADYVDTMFNHTNAQELSDVPFLPVRSFKKFELKSVAEHEVYKTMRSSGTSGKYSQIYLDKKTAQQQTIALVELFRSNFGKGRFPMLVIDSESIIKDRLKFSARTAGVNGFSMFSRGRCFALNDDMQLDFGRTEAFIKEHKDKTIFIFGFTFVIWSAFVEQLKKRGRSLPLTNAFFLHGGGWKKLESKNISNNEFKSVIQKLTGCSAVHNYYGMVEQTGTLFIECKNGCLHAGPKSDALIRDSTTHLPVGHGKSGLIQVFSIIQESYPGHSLLTEDVGRTYAGSDCDCGSKGTIVEIDGRLTESEVRGCSDAYP